MTNIDILAPIFNGNKLGVFSDFDGTLSEIVDQPEKAEITPNNKKHLLNIKDKIPVVGIISGRSVIDLVTRVNVPGLVYVGNHGLERWKNGTSVAAEMVQPYLENIALAAQELDTQLLPGMQLEDKKITLSIHYRQTALPDEVREQFLPVMELIANERNLKLFEGRRIFELRPPIPMDKGTALQALTTELGLDTVLYIGDDITDTVAFKAATKMRMNGKCLAYSVGVVDHETPHSVVELSDTAVEGVAGVASLLSWLDKNLNASST